MERDRSAAEKLDALRTLLGTAQGVVAELATDPLLARVVKAFLTLPAADRGPILRVLERDAAWTRVAAELAPVSGIAVRPNPHASLYVHVFDAGGRPVEPEPSARDASVIRLGIERLLRVLPLLFQEDVRVQWHTAAREIVDAADGELRTAVARLAREVLALIDDAGRRDAGGPR
jgi:hypothetical protein